MFLTASSTGLVVLRLLVWREFKSTHTAYCFFEQETLSTLLSTRVFEETWARKMLNNCHNHAKMNEFSTTVFPLNSKSSKTVESYSCTILMSRKVRTGCSVYMRDNRITRVCGMQLGRGAEVPAIQVQVI